MFKILNNSTIVQLQANGLRLATLGQTAPMVI